MTQGTRPPEVGATVADRSPATGPSTGAGELTVGGAIRMAAPRSRPAGSRLLGVRAVWALPAVVALLASVAWSWRPALWDDEDATVSATTRRLPDLFVMLRHIDVVHGVYYVALHGWEQLAGTSPFALRFPSAVATALAAAGIAVLARRLTGSPATALAAGLAFAVLPTVSYFGMEARSVAFGCAGAVWTTDALLRALAGRSRWWVGYGVLLGVSSAVHVYVLLLPLAHAVALLAARPARAAVLRWLAACLLGLGIAAPVAVAGLGQTGQVSWLPRTRLHTLPGLVVRLYFQESRPVALVAWLLVAVGVVSLVRAHRAGSARRTPGVPGLLAVALPWAAVPPALVFAVSTRHAFYEPRYLFFCIPGIALLIGAGVTAYRSRVVCAVLLLVLLASGIRMDVRSRGQDGKGDDVLTVDRIVAGSQRPGDAVLYRPGARRLVAIGYPHSAIARLDDVGLGRGAVPSATLAGTDAPQAELVARLRSVRRVWVVDRPGAGGLRGADVPRENAALATVGFRQVRRWHTGHSEVQLLVRKTP